MKYSKPQTAETSSIDWKDFYRHVLLLVIPLAVQNLINVGVTAADVVMLGRVGEKALSGASLAGQVQFVMTLVFFGMTSGATVLTAQYWGKGDTKTIEKVLGIGLTAAFAVAFIFTSLALLIPGQLMGIFTNDPVVVREGVRYLRIVGWSYLFMSVTQMYLYIVRSTERVIVATVVYSISLLANICLNWIFIFGNLGFPALGVTGAAIATLSARIIELLIVLWYAHYRNRTVQIRIRNLWHFDRVLVRDCARYSGPVIFNELAWGMGMAAYAAVIGHLGSAAVAANSVAQVARQLAMVVVFGIASATAIYLGRTIGEQKLDLARAYAKRFIWLSLIMGVLGGLIILAAMPIVRDTLALSPEAKDYLRFMFIVMSVYGIGQAHNSTVIVGIFRSGGDTRFGLFLELFSMWGGSIILGILAAFVFKASVPVVYMCLMSDEFIKVPFAIKRFRTFKWLKNVTREMVDKEAV